MTQRLRHVATIFAGLWIALSTHNAVLAQPVDGLYTPASTPTTRADAFSARVNPAQLAFIERFDLGLLIEHDAASTRDVSVGWANALRAGPFGASLGADFVDAVDDTRFTRVAVGLALGSERVALGWGWTGHRSATNRALDRFASSTLGLTVRAGQTFGMSTTLDHVGRPRFEGRALRRVWGLGIGVREPTDRASLDLTWRGVVHAWTSQGVLSTHLRVEPLPGWALFGHADIRPRGRALSSAGAGVELVAGRLRSRVGVWAPDGDAARQTLALEVTRPPRDLIGNHDVLLRIDLAGDIPERPGFAFFGSPAPVLTDHLVSLDEIARHGHVGGAYLVFGGLTTGGAQLHELRGAIERVRAAGGLVVVYLERATIRDLWVASAADHVIASPTLNILDTGLSTTRTYFGTLLSLLGIEAQFVRIGAYKSAPERFTDSRPSPEADEALDRFFDVLWATMRDALIESTGQTGPALDAALADAPLTLDELQLLGLVDAVLPADEVGEHLTERFSRPLRPARALDTPNDVANWWFDPFEVAVLHVTGSIVSGNSSPGILTVSAMTGDATVEATCRALAADPTVDAVVVRIDSPGGSAVASDRMLRALRTLSESVPVRVSMADVAGSGGYYVAAIGDHAPVHAMPTTLTGSIGIYAGTFALDGLLGRLGVNRVHDERGGPSSYYDGRRWTDERRDQVMDSITVSYELFLERVAEARGMTPESVDAVGQGRIWAGVDAAEHGLVDEMDGFLGAIDALRETAGVDARMPTTLRHVATPGPGGLAGALPMVRVFEPSETTALRLARQLGLESGLSMLDAWLASYPGEAMAMTEVVFEGL